MDSRDTTLRENEGTLRIPCGHLAENGPQGPGLLPQGTEGDGGNLVAFLGKALEGNEKMPAQTEAEQAAMVAGFRAYLEGEGRPAHSVRVYCATVRVFLKWLAARNLDPRRLGREEMEKRLGEVYPERRLARVRKCGMHAFWTFLRGTHSGRRLLPVLPESWQPAIERLRSCLSGRGISPGTAELLVREFRFFCRYLVSVGRRSFDPSWDDVARYGAFLAREYMHAAGNIRSAALKLEHASRCLEVLREDGQLPRLPRRQRYEPSVVRHVVPGLGHGYRVLLCAFSEYLEATGMSAACVHTYPLMVRKFLVWLEGTGVSDIREVDERMILAYRGGPASETFEGGVASARTRIHRECGLKKFFLFLYRTRRIHADPAAHMEYTPSPRTLPRAILESWEVDSVLALIDAKTHQGCRDLAVFELLYGTGLRSAELRGLTLADVQVDSRVMLVRGKGNKEALVPFGEKAARALELYLAFARPGLARRGAGADSGLVFLSEHGKRLTPNSLVNIVRRRVEAAGIERNIVPHSLRHSCATHMLRNGADLRVVQQLLRHGSINTTLIYTRMLTSDIREAQRKYHPREMD